MSDMNLKKLQNGSDIRGVALTGVPDQLPNLTHDEAEALAKGYLAWLCHKTGKRPSQVKIAIGRDPRLSGNRLKWGLINGLGPYGTTVYDCGLATTPAMFMSTVFPDFACDGAIMITASHLPFNRNGFKFFSLDGGLNKEDISEIIHYAQDAEAQQILGHADLSRQIRDFGKKTYSSEERNLMGVYSAHLRKMIIDGVNHPTNREQPLSGMKIVVDAGNGGGGFYATEVLSPLGADISQSQFLEPDGMFPNHAPNPEDKEAMHQLSMKVLSTGADFGLIFDTDVDRSSAVDHKGWEIARNGIVALAAALVCEEHPGTTVVTDSITSSQLNDFLENKLGLKHLRFQRGYKNVINKAIALNDQGVDCQLAIETSGHAALKENYFLDDGAYLAAKIVVKAARLHMEGKKINSLIADLTEPLEAKEVRLPITCVNFSDYGDQVLAQLQDFVKKSPGISLEEPNYEGVRITFDHGWCLLRNSLHDPIMPLNVASDKNGGVSEIMQLMYDFLSGYDQLDASLLLKK